MLKFRNEQGIQEGKEFNNQASINKVTPSLSFLKIDKFVHKCRIYKEKIGTMHLIHRDKSNGDANSD